MTSRTTPVSRAVAHIRGSRDFPALHGTVQFRQTHRGVLVTAEILNLPTEGFPQYGVFGFHIHAGHACSGPASDPFAEAGGHYNPTEAPHPFHAGDLPPLFGNDGYAYMEVLTDRFSLAEVIGRTVVIHRQPDDFTSQPAGNAGMRIGCGVIQRG
jgi:Cu-Zn family superoxide dismutase